MPAIKKTLLTRQQFQQQQQAKKIPLTKAAFEEAQSKYETLTKLRSEVMERLKIAREMGDLSENGAYKYAKFELGDIGRQLRKIKHLLDNGYILDIKTSEHIDFGSRVSISHNNIIEEYLLVTQHESNPLQNKLSIESPIGEALIGKKAGEIVVVETPSGSVTYTIVAVQ